MTFDGTTYSLSGAGRAAKVAVVGADASPGVLATDGWQFWRAADTDGHWVALQELRQRFVEQRGGGS